MNMKQGEGLSLKGEKRGGGLSSGHNQDQKGRYMASIQCQQKPKGLQIFKLNLKLVSISDPSEPKQKR